MTCGHGVVDSGLFQPIQSLSAATVWVRRMRCVTLAGRIFEAPEPVELRDQAALGGLDPATQRRNVGIPGGGRATTRRLEASRVGDVNCVPESFSAVMRREDLDVTGVSVAYSHKEQRVDMRVRDHHPVQRLWAHVQHMR